MALSQGNHLSAIDIYYYFLCPVGLFQVNPSTGAVTVARTLDQHPGIYNMTVGVRDSGSPSLFSEAVVHITVLEGNNAAPTWLFPNATYSTVRVLEVSRLVA